MRIRAVGRFLFGLSFAALGGFSIAFPGFAAAWPTVPKWMPLHDPAATFFGALLLTGGVLLFEIRTARAGALLLGCLLLLRTLWLQAPHIVAHPLVEGVWEEVGESAIVIAGAWTIVSLFARNQGRSTKFADVRYGRYLFALALIPIGLSHFFYLDDTAPLIPSWLPFHVPLAYFTGAAWIAAGLGILSGVLARLAATLTAVMAGLFTLLVWVPRVIAAPASAGNWSELCVSAAIAGAAWVVAESLEGASV